MPRVNKVTVRVAFTSSGGGKWTRRDGTQMCWISKSASHQSGISKLTLVFDAADVIDGSQIIEKVRNKLTDEERLFNAVGAPTFRVFTLTLENSITIKKDGKEVMKWSCVSRCEHYYLRL